MGVQLPTSPWLPELGATAVSCAFRHLQLVPGLTRALASSSSASMRSLRAFAAAMPSSRRCCASRRSAASCAWVREGVQIQCVGLSAALRPFFCKLRYRHAHLALQSQKQQAPPAPPRPSGWAPRTAFAARHRAAAPPRRARSPSLWGCATWSAVSLRTVAGLGSAAWAPAHAWRSTDGRAQAQHEQVGSIPRARGCYIVRVSAARANEGTAARTRAARASARAPCRRHRCRKATRPRSCCWPPRGTCSIDAHRRDHMGKCRTKRCQESLGGSVCASSPCRLAHAAAPDAGGGRFAPHGVLNGCI